MTGGLAYTLSSLALGDSSGFWLPSEASTTAPKVDWVFFFILAVSTVFFAVTLFVLLSFIIKYRRRAGVAPSPSAAHNTKLELAWSIIPGGLMLVMFYLGVTTYIDMRTPPEDALEVRVTGQKWSWSFTYPNGHTDPNLHVPVNQPVRLVMTSEDVIHSFFVPDFRLKMDVVPGRYTKAWFTATATGDYQVLCTEYCGTKHSEMLAKVIVHEPGGFETWLKESGNVLAHMSPVEAGKYLYEAQGCKACHSVDGSPGIGPSWKGVFGHQARFADGTSAKADENYLRESIVDPQAKVVAGFGPVMPTYQGKLKDGEITAIIDYIKSLK